MIRMMLLASLLHYLHTGIQIMRFAKVFVVLLLLFVLLVPARSAHSNLSSEVVGSGVYDIAVSTSTFTVYNHRPAIVDLDLNNDYRFNAIDLMLMLGSYERHGAASLGLLLGHWGWAWHRQDFIAADDFGWHYLVPLNLNPVITRDTDGVTTYMSWGQTHSFRTLEQRGDLRAGMQITLESRERRAYFIKMISP